MRSIKVLSTGKYLPKKILTDQDMDRLLGTPSGWVAKKSGVLKRHFVEDETAPMMGAYAAMEAIENAGLKFEDIEAVVCTSGTPTQPIPCNAALIVEALGHPHTGTPAFDINSTCLGFVVGLDTMSYLLEAGRYKRILLVSSEISSIGLNFENKESASLMGDGAAAVVIETTPKGESSHIISSRIETYTEGAHWAEIRGGGTLMHASRGKGNMTDYLFHMDGRKIFKQASKLMLPFCERFLDGTNLGVKDFKLVIPHQASKMALRLIRSKLDLPADQFYEYVEDHGNTISSSIPMGLHNAITSNRIQREDRILLIGTSAGFSIGAIALEY